MNKSEYPNWSWSFSRDSLFNECLRKYYYNYYLAHNGWLKGSSDDSKQAYLLKNLSGIHLLLGSAVHEVAEEVCKNLNLLDEQKLRDKIRKMLNVAWSESKNKREEWLQSPKKSTMLSEFYYGFGISQNVIDRVKNKMENSVKSIINSDTIRDIKDEGCEIESIEAMDTFEIHNTSVYAIPDIVLKKDNDWIVVDWKTGKQNSDHIKQIGIYCMYLKEKWSVPAKDISGRIEYLLTGSNCPVKITEETFDELRIWIKESIDKMKDSLQDPALNKPYLRGDYPLKDDKKFCRWCNFYEMCKEEIS